MEPRTLRALSLTLIIMGVAIALGPTLAIRAFDAYVMQRRQAEVDQWQSRDEVARRTAAVDAHVISPGTSGYLLQIPKIGVRAVVHELEPMVFSGRNTPLLKRYGLGQVPRTDSLANVSPGAEGTAAIAGHRTTSGAPFRHIHRLGPGDLILIQRGPVEQHWEVVHTVTVTPEQVDAIGSRPGIRRLALLACSPPFGDAERIIVYAQLHRILANGVVVAGEGMEQTAGIPPASAAAKPATPSAEKTVQSAARQPAPQPRVVRKRARVQPRASAPATRKPSATAPQAQRRQFILTFGVFGTRGEAEALVQSIRSKGYAARVAPGRRGFAVVSRPYASEARARFWSRIFQGIGVEARVTSRLVDS